MVKRSMAYSLANMASQLSGGEAISPDRFTGDSPTFPFGLTNATGHSSRIFARLRSHSSPTGNEPVEEPTVAEQARGIDAAESSVRPDGASPLRRGRRPRRRRVKKQQDEATMALLQELPAPETTAQRRAHRQVRTLLERASAPWVEDCPNGEVLPGQTSAEVEATIPAPATGELESVADYFAKVKIACSDFVRSRGTIEY